jgi:hypothetical protein
MRADMAKVLVERPRNGGSTKAHYVTTAPNREKIRPRGDRKQFSDLLGPLRRWLDKQVGRPWAKVNAELAARVRFDSTTQRHILTHLEQWVETRTSRIKGVLHGPWGPIAEYRHWYRRIRDYYVCPDTGLLKASRQGRSRNPTPSPKEEVRVDGREYVRRDGVWFEVLNEKVWMFDGVSDILREVSRLRSLSKREIRDLGLVNRPNLKPQPVRRAS